MRWLKRKLKGWLNSPDDYSNELRLVAASDSNPTTSPSDSFRGDFHGWQFRMHRAIGGTVLEAWRYPDSPNYINKSTGGQSMDRELFIISANDDINVELPQILTQLALR